MKYIMSLRMKQKLNVKTRDPLGDTSRSPKKIPYPKKKS